MALPLTSRDRDLLLSALGLPETRDRVVALLDLAGTGNMTGPGSSTDNAMVRFDGTTGALVQNSGVIVDDSNNMSGVALFSAANANLSSLTASNAIVANGSKNLISSVTTAAELAFLSGVSSSVQTQLNAKVNDTGDTLTGPLLFAAGSAAAPSVSFSADPNTGMYSPGADSISFAANGADQASISVGAISAAASVQFVAQLGSAAAPGYSFAADLDSGIYSSGADQVDVATGGVLRFSVSSSAISAGASMQYVAQLGAVGAPAYSFSGDLNTGIYSSGANSIDFATDGVSRLQISDVAILPSLQLQNALGSNAAPSYSFAGDPNTGMYSSGADSVDFATAGVNAGSISSAQSWTIGQGTATVHRINAQLQAPAAGVLTLANGPGASTGDPAVYLTININGTPYVIPAWVF